MRWTAKTSEGGGGEVAEIAAEVCRGRPQRGVVSVLFWLRVWCSGSKSAVVRAARLWRRGAAGGPRGAGGVSVGREEPFAACFAVVRLF